MEASPVLLSLSIAIEVLGVTFQDAPWLSFFFLKEIIRK